MINFLSWKSIQEVVNKWITFDVPKQNLNKMEEKDLKKFYVARDKNGTLAMFVEKPIRVKKDEHGKNYWKVSGFGHGMWMYLYNDMFPELKWKDEPKLVSIEEII